MSAPGKVYLIGSAQPRTVREAFRRAHEDTGVARPRIAASFAPLQHTRGVAGMTSFLAGHLLGAEIETFTVAGEHGAMPAAEARAIIARADIVFINGGDPILGARRLVDAGADGWIREARRRGAVCMGLSAGSMALCAAWGSWEEDEHGEPEIVPGLRVVPGLVIDCHAEADDWEELRAVKRAMGAEGSKLTFAGVGSGCALVVGANDDLEWIGPAMVLSG
jgi:cyanophycinase-like exopeptidase